MHLLCCTAPLYSILCYLSHVLFQVFLSSKISSTKQLKQNESDSQENFLVYFIYKFVSINQTTEPLRHPSITTDIDLKNSFKVKRLKIPLR